jgi:hypothetical protein
MHAVIKIIFYIDHTKNADNWVVAILDIQISKCYVISGYVERNFELLLLDYTIEEESTVQNEQF